MSILMKFSIRNLRIERLKLVKSGTDRFVNSYMIVNEEEEKCVLIDTGFEEHFDTIVDSIGKKDLEYIFITHCHLDHCGCAVSLRDHFGSQIVTSEYDGEKFRAGENSDLIPTSSDFEEFLETIPTGQVYQGGVPDFTLSDSDEVLEIRDFGFELVVFLTKGHTKGSISVVNETTKDCFVGDLLYPNEDPEFGFGSPGFLVSLSDFEESCTRLRDLENVMERIHTGHADNPIPFEDFLAFSDSMMLKS